MVAHLYPIALGLAFLLAGHGYRKGSLAGDGALAAFTVGYITLGNPLSTFGVLLIVFYLVGSRATKVKANIKATLEREAEQKSPVSGPASSHKAASGGQRDAVQVFCNSFSAVIAALLFRVLFSGELPPTYMPSVLKPYARNFGDGSTWCTQTLGTPTTNRSYLAAQNLLLVALGHFACCMGDTLASELGILSRSRPRLVTNPFRVVPPGTNGGISILGTLFSLLGGALMGATAAVSLYVSNSACRNPEPRFSILVIGQPKPHGPLWGFVALVLLGAAGGLGGSMLDSLMGATLQQTRYSTRTSHVLLNPSSSTARVIRKASKEQRDEIVIAGWDVLSNSQVNLISSILTGLATAYVGSLLT